MDFLHYFEGGYDEGVVKTNRGIARMKQVSSDVIDAVTASIHKRLSVSQQLEINFAYDREDRLKITVFELPKLPITSDLEHVMEGIRELVNGPFALKLTSQLSEINRDCSCDDPPDKAST